MPQPIPGQLAIPVPAAPEAVGRWTEEHEFKAYAREKGAVKAAQQKARARAAKQCNCGAQAAEDAAAKEEDRRSKKISGHLHKAGCPQLRTFGTRTPRISGDEQIRRYTTGGEE